MSSTSSAAVSVTLAADGKNWKDWIKQIINYASADNAFKVLDGKACPSFDATDDKYNVTPLHQPSYLSDALPSEVAAEMTRIHKINKALRDLNEDARRSEREDETAYNMWVARDARLQNTILSSIKKPHVAQIRASQTANAMYRALKELNCRM
ncbi:hypothetical protein EJ02DRAFT_161516 [Clathrospora elynae]|uniref:Uncharacterized protein n=1 Tax=Clathrospora elynae TaxID=706981 RepID=A0A6A5S2I5_9PLEO|nr:hypothetical protein EJ02DRAFT_161516 [Clathrospora elynae]